MPVLKFRIWHETGIILGSCLYDCLKLMILDCAGVPTHLSYCTNVHTGDAWCDVLPELERQLPQVRSAMGYLQPMGIGLRLSSSSAKSLQEPDTLAAFSHWLERNDYYVYTLNGFPYGTFHGERVKEDVYKPDWTEPERLEYTCALADILCKLDPPDNYGSISTLPGTYKDWMMPGTEQRISENMVKAVAHCVRLHQTTGVTIALAVEPEPCCMLETIGETITFFKEQLFSQNAIDALAQQTGLDGSAAKGAMHRHVGVCYDVCHSAVEFENPAHAIAKLRSAGIQIIKIQLSSALEISNVNEASLRQLSRYDEPVYLHQVVEKRGDTITRYNDISAATVALRYRMEQRSVLDPNLQIAINQNTMSSLQPTLNPVLEDEACWRVHFHVPVYMEHTEHFTTTQSSLKQVLQLQQMSGFCRHLEVETYTWNVLPEACRQQSVSEAIAGELSWVRDRL
mgnify:CR=1 FL=1